MRRFKKEKWDVCEVKGKRSKLPIPKSTCVYMIVIFKIGICKRRIVYIGSTKSLYVRMSTHDVLQKITRNLIGYNIEIWHKDFGCYETNFKEENLMIYKIKPPFNLSCSSKKLPNKIYDFWVSVGVTHLLGRYRHKHTIEYLLRPTN